MHVNIIYCHILIMRNFVVVICVTTLSIVYISWDVSAWQCVISSSLWITSILSDRFKLIPCQFITSITDSVSRVKEQGSSWHFFFWRRRRRSARRKHFNVWIVVFRSYGPKAPSERFSSFGIHYCCPLITFTKMNFSETTGSKDKEW